MPLEILRALYNLQNTFRCINTFAKQIGKVLFFPTFAVGKTETWADPAMRPVNNQVSRRTLVSNALSTALNMAAIFYLLYS